MKIYEFSPFYNENMLLKIKAAEAKSWIDEIHVVESNRTFRYGHKPYQFKPEEFKQRRPRVIHHKLDGTLKFDGANKWGISKKFPFYRKKDISRANETIQRNLVHEVLAPEDDDIVILSDIDEILDSSRADELIHTTQKHGLVSVRLHHTMFFLNLYSENWHELWKNSPVDYAYRTFLMTGKVYRSLPYTSDRLRRLGEWGKHAGKIPLVDGFSGFHHSWLGDANAVKSKLLSYSHSIAEHGEHIVDEKGEVSIAKLKTLVESKQSIFDGHDLSIRTTSQQPLLSSIMGELEHFDHLLVATDPPAK